MKLTIKTSGGIGGFGLSPKPAIVDVGKLETKLRERVRAAFALPKLKSLAKAPGNPHAADMIGYEITVTADSGATERIELSGEALPPELLDLIDELMASG